MVDIVTRLGKGSPLTNAEVDANFTNLAEVAGVTGEPMGHEDRTTSTISFNASTRTFTIAPVAASFTVWCKGKKVVVSSAQTVTIPNTTGMYSIYFDANGALSAKAGYFTFSLEAPTAYIYWNASSGTCPYFGDERHGVVLDWQTHEYLHRTRGAALASGFAASGYVLGGNGSSNSHAQLTLEGGTFFDEDMKIVVTATNTPTAGTWEQDLLSPARIPVLYLSGTAWVIDAPTDYPLKQGTSRPQYNAYSGGVWSTADVANNKYGTTWILATNNLTYPVIAIIGQAESDSQNAAEAVDFTALQLPGFPAVEFRPLYKLVFQCADSCSNAVHSSLVSVTDIRSIAAAGVAASLVTDHGNLTGLSDDDHPQYIHVDTLRTVSAAVKASFLPPQAGNTGKFFQTDGTATSWASITSGNITSALGFTPYNSTNPSGYVNVAGARTSISVTGAGTYDSATGVINIVGGVTSVAGKTGVVTLSSSDVGLGNVENKSSATIRSEITSTNVTTALGFTPYNATNPAGYISGNQSISLSGDVSGSGATAITVALTNSGVTAGTYSNATVTVDAKGRITSASSGVSGGVTSFNSRTGAVSLSSADVTTALGFTPYNSSNPNGYITSSGSISGTAAYATTSIVTDSRATATTPQTLSGAGVVFDFKQNATESLSDGGTYFGEMTFRQYGSGTDWSGGLSHQMGFTDNGNVWQRSGAGTTWGSWKKLLDSSNYSSYALPLSGGTLSGDLTINHSSASIKAGMWDGANVRVESVGRPLYVVSYGGDISIGRSGGSNFVVGNTGISFGGNQVLHAGNYSSYANASYLPRQTANTSFYVGGSSSTYYPVLFTSSSSYTDGWNAATYFELHRDDVHENFSAAGSFRLRVYAQYSSWGHRPGQVMRVEYTPGYGTYGDAVGDVTAGDYREGNVVVWLRGGMTYHLKSLDWAYTYVSVGNPSGTSITTSYATYNSISSQSTTIVNAKNGLALYGNAVLTSSNYSSYALPLSGGTVSGTIGSARNDVQRLFESYNTSAGSQTQFYIDHSYGDVNIGNARGSIKIQGSVALHAGNYSSYAIGRGGDTVDGVFYFRSNKGSGSYVGGQNTYGLEAFSGDGGAAGMSFHRGGYYAVNMGLDPDNVFRIGGWSASANRFQMDMSGNLTMAGNIAANSDERLKTNWMGVADDYVERLAKVKGGTYTRVDSGERQAGSSAQDWQKLLPEVVQAANDEDKTLSLAYGNAALVSAIELAKRVVAQEERIKRLESLIETLIGN